MGARVSPQTLACLTLLTYVVIVRAARSGLFSICSRTASPGISRVWQALWSCRCLSFSK